MKKLVTNFLVVVQLFSLFIAGILFIIFKVSFNFTIYKNFYTTNSLATELKITDVQLLDYTQNLLNYLKIGTELDSTWFTTKDILHMVDVRNLYIYAHNTMLILFLIVLVSTILLYVLHKNKFLQNTLIHFNKILILFAFIIGVLCLFVFSNFNSFWIKFHEIFFTNDLWLLSPLESNLIKMFPEQFFFELVSKILIFTFLYFALLFGIKFSLRKMLKI